MNTCAACGHEVLVNLNAGDWDWPYACSFCDAERLPEHLRAPEKRKGYVARPLTRWQHFKKAVFRG